MKNLSLKKILILTLLVMMSGVAWVVYCAVRNGFDLSHIPLKDYNNLFIQDIQNDLNSPYVYKSKIREPTSNYILSNNFHLTVNRLILNSDRPLEQILRLENGQVSRSYETYSTYAEDSELKMTGTTDRINPVSFINFDYNGSITRLAMNDSLACYYLKFKAFSLSYDENSDNDIYANAAGSNNVAISLAFIKKKNYVYVVLLFKTKDETKDFPQDSLYKLIRK